MFSLEIKVGRLAEVRLVVPISMKDIEGIRAAVSQLFQQQPGKLVFVTDMTRATIFTPAEAMRVVEVFKADNPRVELSVFLLNHGISFHHQLERLISQAGNPARRCFHDRDELKTFLRPTLTQEEQDRLAQFFSQRP